MVVTLTLNPTVDHTVNVPELRRGTLHRIAPIRTDMSGKGLNVSLALQALGQESTAIALLGGPRGHLIDEDLRNRGIRVQAVWMDKQTRMCLKIFEETSATLTELNEPGPEVRARDLDAIITALEEVTHKGDLVVVSGSMPPGTPVDFYARVVRKARDREVDCIVDADGEALRLALAEGLYLLKPNEFEAGQLVGRTLRTEDDAVKALDELAQRAPIVVLTMGAQGFLAAGPAGRFRVVPPRVKALSTAGCGDSLLAALLWALDRGNEWQEALRFAAAAAAATAELPGTTFPTLEQVRNWLPAVEVHTI